MYIEGAPSREDVRIVICKKGMDMPYDKCTFCNSAFQCNAAFQTKSKPVADTIRSNYLAKGHDVMVINCECKENETEARTVPQILITRTDVLFSGGTDESNYLRKRWGGNAAC